MIVYFKNNELVVYNFEDNFEKYFDIQLETLNRKVIYNVEFDILIKCKYTSADVMVEKGRRLNYSMKIE